MRYLKNTKDVHLMFWESWLFNEKQQIKLVAKKPLNVNDIIFSTQDMEKSGYKVLEVVEKKESKIKEFPLYITAVAVKCKIYEYERIEK